MTSFASSSQLSRILLGALIGAVLGLLMLGVALAAWWLAVARHTPQPIVAPEGFEARLEEAAGGAAFGLSPVYAYEPDSPRSSGAVWLSQISSGRRGGSAQRRAKRSISRFSSGSSVGTGRISWP